MRCYLLLFLSTFILSGCGSSDATSSSDLDEQTNSEIESSSEELEYEADLVDVDDTVQDESEEYESAQQDDTEQDGVDYSAIQCDDYLEQVIDLVNMVRSESQVCGSTTYPAVDDVTWNDSLYLAAQEHSDNMANYDFFSHTGEDGGTVGTRVTAQQYEWRYVSENIAAGQTSAQAIIDGWLDSEGHCKNLMSESVSEMGLACTSNSDAYYTRYWTQVFASPL